MNHAGTAELTIRGVNGRMRATVRWPLKGGRPVSGLILFPDRWLDSGTETATESIPDEFDTSGALTLTMHSRDASGFASAVNDATEAAAWFAEHGSDLGVELSELVIAGAGKSAGVVLEAARRLRETGGPAISHVIIVDPRLGGAMCTSGGELRRHPSTNKETKWER